MLNNFFFKVFMIFYTSIRGNTKLAYQGKDYNFQRMVDNNRRFRCTDRRCRGALILGPQNDVLETRPHSCIITQANINANIAGRRIQERINTTSENIVDIYTTVTAEQPNNVLSRLPSYRTIRDYATRLRNRRNNYITEAINDIPPVLRQTLDNKLFLQYDSGYEDPARFIIFFHEDFLDIQ